MHDVKAVLVNWGPNVDTGSQAADQGFLQDFASMSGKPGNVMAVAAQYSDASGPAANTLAYRGQYTITPSTSATTVTNAQIGTELANQVGAGHLPTPETDASGTPDTVFVVNFPPGVTIDLSGAKSGQQFCAFHASKVIGTAHTPYVVLPDFNNASFKLGCSDGNYIHGQTGFLSLTLLHAKTNPLLSETNGVLGAPAAWFTSGLGGIGDICGAPVLTTNTIGADTWYVNKAWINNQAACVGTPNFGTPTATFSGPTTTAAGQPASFDGSTSSTPSQNHGTTVATGNTSYKHLTAGIASYSWDFGDGSTGSGAQVSHAYAHGGTYTVALRATDNLGFVSDPATQQVAVAGDTGGNNGQVPGGGSSRLTQCKVPKLNGKTLKFAKRALSAAHCKLGKVSRRKGPRSKRGKVVGQSPRAGTVKPAGTKVSLVVGK